MESVIPLSAQWGQRENWNSCLVVKSQEFPFLQGILPEGSEERRLLGLQPLLRRLRLRHRERQEEGGRGGDAGEPRGERLQHRPQHLLLQEPPAGQPDPQGELSQAFPEVLLIPAGWESCGLKSEPKFVSVPHKSELFMGSVSKRFQLFILETQKGFEF